MAELKAFVFKTCKYKTNQSNNNIKTFYVNYKMFLNNAWLHYHNVQSQNYSELLENFYYGTYSVCTY